MTTVFVIMGTCGSYSERREWPVCYAATKAAAEAHVARLTSEWEPLAPLIRDAKYPQNEQIRATFALDPHDDVSEWRDTAWYVMEVEPMPEEPT